VSPSSRHFQNGAPVKIGSPSRTSAARGPLTVFSLEKYGMHSLFFAAATKEKEQKQKQKQSKTIESQGASSVGAVQ